ncbi:hypothetical protein DER44DRAFT_801874 [Fusarium oxysporum]|nr:hypothetical protein DER44DRAFT_801874 [Fusarium oxysporum]
MLPLSFSLYPISIQKGHNQPAQFIQPHTQPNRLIMATIAQQHLPDSPPSNTNSDTQATGRRTDGSERGEGEGRWLLYNEELSVTDLCLPRLCSPFP